MRCSYYTYLDGKNITCAKEGTFAHIGKYGIIYYYCAEHNIKERKELIMASSSIYEVVIVQQDGEQTKIVLPNTLVVATDEKAAVVKATQGKKLPEEGLIVKVRQFSSL